MIDKVIKSATDFLKKEFNKAGTIIKVRKVDGGWEVKFEVVEKDDYVATIAPESTTYARNIYAVKLGPKFNVISCENLGQKYTHPKNEEEEEES